ncbi:MAG: hypothetical protein ACI4BA_04790 [Prevotella sp.]
MASIDEEIRIAEQEDAKEMAYIRKTLPADLKEKYSDSDLLFMMGAIVDYFYESHVLEGNANDYVDIDMDKISEYVCQRATQEKLGPYIAEEVFFVVQADIDYQENCD